MEISLADATPFRFSFNKVYVVERHLIDLLPLLPNRSSAELKVWLVLYAQTHGLGRQHVEIGYSQLRDLTGVSFAAVRQAILSLRRMGWIKLIEKWVPYRSMRGARYEVLTVDRIMRHLNQ